VPSWLTAPCRWTICTRSLPGRTRRCLRLLKPTVRSWPMSEKTCAIEGCERPHLCRDLCSAHYQRLKRHGDPLGSAKKRVKRSVVPCSVEACDRKVVARGLCHAHYDYWRQHVDPNRVPCKVEGCEVGARTKGYCKSHYNRFKRHGDPLLG